MNIKKNLDSVIYDQIINSLIMGEYEMGEQILLDAFAEKYGVSRTPVVQAVKLLANDGILEILKNGRVRVPVYTSDQIAQICDIRILLELYALDEIFKDCHSPKFDELCDNLCELADTAAKYVESGDNLAFNKADLNFHRVLIKGANNEFLTDLYKRIQGRFVVANYLFIPWENRGFTDAAHAHQVLMEAFRKKDLPMCKEVLTKHIQNVAQVAH